MCSVRWFSPRKHYFTFVSSSSTHRDSHSAGVCRRLSTVQTNLRTVTHRAQHTANFFILTYICRVRSVCVYCVGFFGVASRHHSATFTFGSAGAAISVSSTCTCREQQQQKKNRKEIINIAQTSYMKRHLLKTAAVDCFYYTCLFYISVLAVFYSSSTLLLLTTHCVIVCDVCVCVCPIGSIACNLQHPSSHAYHRNGFIRNNDRRHHKITHSTFRVRKQTEQQPR